MGRPKGALNHATRSALRKAMSGKLGEEADSVIRRLLRLAKDGVDEQVRMQAAQIVLPYLRPKLSAVEHSEPEELPAEADIISSIQALLRRNPELRSILLQKLNADLAHENPSVGGKIAPRGRSGGDSTDPSGLGGVGDETSSRWVDDLLFDISF